MSDTPKHTDDRTLFSRIAEGEEWAYRELYHRYGKMLFPFLLKLTGAKHAADDLIQETMLRVWLNRDQLSDVDHPRAWIHRIASNLALNWLRRNTVHEQAVEHTFRSGTTAEEDPLSNLTVQAIRTVVQQTLDSMPPQRRLIYRMHRDQGKRTVEIAEELGISVSTVKNTLITAARTIREQVAKAGYTLPIWLLALFF